MLRFMGQEEGMSKLKRWEGNADEGGGQAVEGAS